MTPPPRHPATPQHAGEDADAREFEAFAQGQDPLDMAAATWVARRRNGLDAQGEAELQAWLDADPRHGEAFGDMADILGEVQQLPGEDVASLRTGLPDDTTPMAPGLARTAPTWLSWAGGLTPLWPRFTMAALMLLVIGGGLLGWDHWRQLPTFERAYATARGQRLTASLPDADSKGSVMQLDTATQVHARLYRDRREVFLKDGQAMLIVSPQAGRPFHVRAGALRITVVGTRFAVRHTLTGLEAGQTMVSVEEGHVKVERVATGPDDSTPAVNLTAGQQVVADATGHIGTVQHIPPKAIAMWRDGRISFDHTPLAQAVAEFERYGPTGLVVRDPAVGALPVGGSYNLRQFQRFAEALPEVLPVRLVRQGDVTEVMAR